MTAQTIEIRTKTAAQERRYGTPGRATALTIRLFNAMSIGVSSFREWSRSARRPRRGELGVETGSPRLVDRAS